jgi:hypothetical protein
MSIHWTHIVAGLLGLGVLGFLAAVCLSSLRCPFCERLRCRPGCIWRSL